MKKGIALLLMLVVLLGVSQAVADGNNSSFRPSLTNGFECSADDWFQSSNYRALLTIMMAFDYADEKSSFDPAEAVLGSTYVGMSSDHEYLLLVYVYDGKAEVILYTPDSGNAMYSLDTVYSSESAVEQSYKEAGYTYYRNSQSTLVEVAEIVSEALEE